MCMYLFYLLLSPAAHMGDALGIVLMHGIVEGSDKSIIECQSSIMCLVLRLTLCVFLKV